MSKQVMIGGGPKLRYAYKIVVACRSDEAEAKLSAAAADGWKLVACAANEIGVTWTLERVEEYA